MEKIKKGFIWFWSNPRCVFWLGMAVTLLATSLEVFRGRNTNYFDYQDSTRMFWEGISPYTLEYAYAHCIYFLYSPVFSVLFAPIFFLPWWLGPFVWNISNYCLYTLAIHTLPERFNKYKHWIFLFMLPVVLQTIFCYQHNIIVAYIFIFAYSLLERNHNFWAVLLIMVSACTKVYGGAELALLLCYPKMWRNFGYAIICGAGLLCLPLLNHNFDNPLMLYQQMFEMIGDHHSDSDFIGILFARGLKPFLLPNYRLVQLSVLGGLAAAFFACYKRWKTDWFRTCVMSVLSGYIILFSDCPETHTYIIALGPWVMAFWMMKERKWYDWVLFWSLVVNFGILPTDVLCPAWLHEWVHRTLWLDVYTFFMCWLRILYLAVKPMKLSRTLKPLSILFFLLPMATISAQTKTYNVKGVQFTMKFVQGGTFNMGNPYAKGYIQEDEKPVRKLMVNNFYIGETEVTQELWEAVMGKNRSKIKGPNQPVDYVTYEDCHKFLERLNQMTGQHFRLPSEAEWEYAARGGRKSRHYKYAGSNNIDEVAWYRPNSNDLHYPVAQKKPNELGLYDMSGNVWEWCEDGYGKYGSKKHSTEFFVIRGGGYDSPDYLCRTTNRYMYDKRRRRNLLGLRLCLDAGSPKRLK